MGLPKSYVSLSEELGWSSTYIMYRVGQNRIYTPYTTVNLDGTSAKNTVYIYMVLANLNHVSCVSRVGQNHSYMYTSTQCTYGISSRGRSPYVLTYLVIVYGEWT